MASLIIVDASLISAIKIQYNIIGHINGQNVNTWSLGYNYCAKDGENLPLVQTKQDIKKLSRQMEEQHLQTAWLGIRKMPYDGLRWMDGTGISKIHTFTHIQYHSRTPFIINVTVFLKYFRPCTGAHTKPNSGMWYTFKIWCLGSWLLSYTFYWWNMSI